MEHSLVSKQAECVQRDQGLRRGRGGDTPERDADAATHLPASEQSRSVVQPPAAPTIASMFTSVTFPPLPAMAGSAPQHGKGKWSFRGGNG